MRKKLILFIAIVIFAVALVGCGKKEDKSALVGSWDYSGFVYKFYSDKTGVYVAGGTEMNFTYEDDGEKVTIKYEGNTEGSSYEYKIEDNELHIKDSFGNEVTYYRK